MTKPTTAPSHQLQITFDGPTHALALSLIERSEMASMSEFVRRAVLAWVGSSSGRAAVTVPPRGMATHRVHVRVPCAVVDAMRAERVTSGATQDEVTHDATHGYERWVDVRERMIRTGAPIPLRIDADLAVLAGRTRSPMIEGTGRGSA